MERLFNRALEDAAMADAAEHQVYFRVVLVQVDEDLVGGLLEVVAVDRGVAS